MRLRLCKEKPTPVTLQNPDLDLSRYPSAAKQRTSFTTTTDEHLSRSVDAVALAYLNYQRYSSSAQVESRQQYVKALSLTSSAIQNPELARKDSTILAILLLDLYEKITNNELKFEGAWAAHLSGALSLVKLRGDQQFKDPNALRMLIRLSTNLLISCVTSDRIVSAELVALRSIIAAHLPQPCDPKWQESDLVIEFAKLRQDIKDGVLSNDMALSSLVDLDAKFLRLSLNVPLAWQYETVQVDEKSIHHYELFHHVYPAEHVSQMWNTLRLTRILLNELICLHCLKDEGYMKINSKALAVHEYATRTIREMASGICASVPTYIGHHSGSFEMSMTSTDPSGIIPARDAHALSVGQSNVNHRLPCYRLIYPLYVAAQSFAAPRSLKPWVIGQLHFMADIHATENAAAVAKVLESGEKRNLGQVYAMLGSYAFVC
ncbi:hypothetical protein MMC17_007412 [Xylographa soralifera]|nr:hypothetical protein [Xylographa soralifera]